MTPDSMVTLRATAPLSTPLPDEVLPLSAFLTKLEMQGHVRVKMHKHKIEKEEGPAVTRFKISSVEPVALEPTVRERGDPNLGSLAAFVDLASTKTSELLRVVHRLEFYPKGTSVNCGYPAVYLTKSLRVRAGQAVALVRAAKDAK